MVAICGVALTPGDRESTMELLRPFRICTHGNSNETMFSMSWLLNEKNRNE